jgi:hypothetical protein
MVVHVLNIKLIITKHKQNTPQRNYIHTLASAMKFIINACLFIALMMKAAHTSETSVYFNVTTRRYKPEDS